jgi:hypothetical protein
MPVPLLRTKMHVTHTGSSPRGPTGPCPWRVSGGAGSGSNCARPTCASPPDEAAALLNCAMGLGLAADSVAALASRTEGWIAGRSA